MEVIDNLFDVQWALADVAEPFARCCATRCRRGDLVDPVAPHHVVGRISAIRVGAYCPISMRVPTTVHR